MTDFADVINEWIDETEQSVEDTIQTVTNSLAMSAVTLSPVDTGRFKGNWQLTLNAPSTNSLIRYDREGSVTLHDIASKSNAIRIGDVIYLDNNVEYGQLLEDGHSKQSEGMVRITGMRFPRIVDDAAKINRRS